MARKRSRFEWTAEEGFAERVERPNRSREKARIREVERMVVRLAALPARIRRTLPLDAATQEALAGVAALGKGPALKRARLRATTLLMDADPEAIEAALSGDSARDDLLRELERWRTRLVAEGDPAVQAFVEAYPAADRQRLRQLARAAQGEGDAAARAVKRLFAELRKGAGT